MRSRLPPVLAAALLAFASIPVPAFAQYQIPVVAPTAPLGSGVAGAVGNSSVGGTALVNGNAANPATALALTRSVVVNGLTFRVTRAQASAPVHAAAPAEAGLAQGERVSAAPTAGPIASAAEVAEPKPGEAAKTTGQLLRTFAGEERGSKAGETRADGRQDWDGDGGGRKAAGDFAPRAQGTGSSDSKLARPAKFAAAVGALTFGVATPALAAAAGAGLASGDMVAAVAAGVVAFLSPCVLPLIPAYISFISGMSRDELMKGDNRAAVMKKAGLGSVVFVAGFTAAFVALGATATALGAFLMQYLPYLSKGAGALIILFGLHSAGILKIPFLYRDVRYHDAIKPGLVGAFLMGLAFAFGWTPCVGPVLAGILALAAKSETVWQGMGLLSLFSVGLGVPFILTGFSVNGFLTFFNRYKKYIGWGEKAAGGLLVVMGLLMLTDNMGLLLKWIPEFFYKFAH